MSEQSLLALVEANRARAARHRLRRELAAASRSSSPRLLAERLERGDAVVMGMPVEVAVLAVNGIGATRARVVLRAADITVGMTRVRDLSPRQRRVIAELLQTMCIPREVW